MNFLKLIKNKNLSSSDGSNSKENNNSTDRLSNSRFNDINKLEKTNMTPDEIYQKLEKEEINTFKLNTPSSILEFGSNLESYFEYACGIFLELISLQNTDDEKTIKLKNQFEDIYNIETYNVAYNYFKLKEESILIQIKKIEELTKILTFYVNKTNYYKNKLLEINIEDENLNRVVNDRINSFDNAILVANNQIATISNWLIINGKMKNKLNELKNTAMPLLMITFHSKESTCEVVDLKQKIDILLNDLFYSKMINEEQKSFIKK